MSINSNSVQINPNEESVKCVTLSVSESIKNVEIVKKKSFFDSLPERIPAYGILLILISETMFSLASLIVKVLTEMHAVEVLFFRCMVQFVPFLIISVKGKYPLFGLPGHRINLMLRCISGTLALICLYMAYRLMPLSDASTVFNTSPIFVTIFAYFLLKEPITLVHGLTGILTVVGVFVISKPEFIFGRDDVDDIYDQRILGMVLSVVAALAAGYTLINLKKLKTTPVPIIVMWYSAFAAISSAIVIPILDKWVMPSSVYSWFMLLAIGVAGILHQYFLTTALKYESPGPCSVARSFNIVLAFIWEVAIFHEPVEWTSILGACIVTLCVIITALVKWYNDEPTKFRNFFKGVFSLFCHKKEKKDLDSVPNCSQPSIESIERNLTQHSTLPIIKI